MKYAGFQVGYAVWGMVCYEIYFRQHCHLIFHSPPPQVENYYDHYCRNYRKSHLFLSKPNHYCAAKVFITLAAASMICAGQDSPFALGRTSTAQKRHKEISHEPEVYSTTCFYQIQGVAFERYTGFCKGTPVWKITNIRLHGQTLIFFGKEMEGQIFCRYTRCLRKSTPF